MIENKEKKILKDMEASEIKAILKAYDSEQAQFYNKTLTCDAGWMDIAPSEGMEGAKFIDYMAVYRQKSNQLEGYEEVRE